MYWLPFLISAGIIIFSGVRLTTYADQLGDHLKFGKIWIGIILLGFVTSLPELVTSLVSVISVGSADLAVGNLLGSNNFNPMLIVMMDLVYRKGSVTNAVVPLPSHKTSAIFTIILSLIVIGEILFGAQWPVLAGGRLSVGGLGIVFIYFFGMKWLTVLGAKEAAVHPVSTASVKSSLPKVCLNLGMSAALIVVAAVVLTHSADALAEHTGLGRTFVGTIFLALVTSLPEMVVTISALKLGSFDLAVGNIFGSNMINIFIIPVCDMFYPGELLLSGVATTHVFTAILSVTLIAIMFKGISTRDKKSILGLGWDSAIMLVLFCAGAYFLYWFK